MIFAPPKCQVLKCLIKYCRYTEQTTGGKSSLLIQEHDLASSLYPWTIIRTSHFLTNWNDLICGITRRRFCLFKQLNIFSNNKMFRAHKLTSCNKKKKPVKMVLVFMHLLLRHSQNLPKRIINVNKKRQKWLNVISGTGCNLKWGCRIK